MSLDLLKHWIRHSESRTLNQWLTDVCFETVDGQCHVLTAGPKIDRNLELLVSSNEIADLYLKLSSLFLISNTGEIVPRAQITKIEKTNRFEPTIWERTIWLNLFKTRWRRKIDKPLRIC